jgi:hypothetical protein
MTDHDRKEPPQRPTQQQQQLRPQFKFLNDEELERLGDKEKLSYIANAISALTDKIPRPRD